MEKTDECCNNYSIHLYIIIIDQYRFRASFSKTIEEHVLTHSNDFLPKQNLLVNTQFGFREHQSCQTALLTLIERIYKAINE